MLNFFKNTSIDEYIRESIKNENYEFEIIYGINKYLLKRQDFLNLLNQCREKYETVEPKYILDITFNEDKFLDKIRLSINGKNNIIKYCNDNDIHNINNSNYDIIMKNNIKKTIFDNEYNLRLNLKEENNEIDKDKIDYIKDKNK